MDAHLDWAGALARAHAAFADLDEGATASYIPELANVDRRRFGLALVRVDGASFHAGDAYLPFAIESIAKPFTLARALADVGADAVAARIGAVATGHSFNSVMAIELHEGGGRPPTGSPLVNAGAIATVGLVAGGDADERWARIRDHLARFAGRPLAVDERVYQSESATNAHNRAITWLLESYGVLDGAPEVVLDLYTRQCSLLVTAHDLAVMGAVLATGGVHPADGSRVLAAEHAAAVLAAMATYGLYETTGDWLFRVGVPAKSGVGGGLMAVVPGRYAVAGFSPPLDRAGNSVRAQRAIAHVVRELGGNVFAAARRPPPVTR